jgi:predicted MFS family arabinose efflux permease
MSVSESSAQAKVARPRVPLASWYVLGVLTCVAFFAYMDRIALAILVEPIKADLHLSDGQFGLLSGLAFAIFYATLGVPVARLADRASRVKVLSASLVIWSAMTALSGLARSFPQLFLARVGVGVGEAGCVPSAHSILGDHFPGERRALAISIFQCGAVAGLSGGLILISHLAETIGWRMSLQIIGLAGVPMSFLIMFTVREPPRPHLTGGGQEPAWAALGALLRRPALVHLMIAYALSAVGTLGVGQWVPAYLMRSFGLTMSDVGIWAGASSLVSGVLGLLTGGLVAGRLVPRDPRWEIGIPGLAFGISTPLYAFAFLAPSPALAVASFTLGSYLSAVGGGVALSAVQTFAEPHRRATAVSLVLFLSALLGQGLGPYLVGLGSDLLEPAFGRESLRYAMLLTSVILAWSAIHYALAVRTMLRDRVTS